MVFDGFGGCVVFCDGWQVYAHELSLVRAREEEGDRDGVVWDFMGFSTWSLHCDSSLICTLGRLAKVVQPNFKVVWRSSVILALRQISLSIPYCHWWYGLSCLTLCTRFYIGLCKFPAYMDIFTNTIIIRNFVICDSKVWRSSSFSTK